MQSCWKLRARFLDCTQIYREAIPYLPFLKVFIGDPLVGGRRESEDEKGRQE
jgi:hypothetical protein